MQPRSNSSTNKLKTVPSSSLCLSKKKRQGHSMNRLNTVVSDKLAKGYRYDKMLFHKTIFHLRPMSDNPEVFIREVSLTTQLLDHLKYKKNTQQRTVIPHPVNMRQGLQRSPGQHKMLKDETLSHLTAKKWLIYNMEESYIVKGYKYRQNHDVASLSKILTFYTAYDIVKEYFLVVSSFEIMVLPSDSKVGGTMLRLNQQEDCLITLYDAMSALLMTSANNIALAIANNLGSYLIKQTQKQYFSCFDLEGESREVNVGAFMQRMRKLAAELGLKECKVSSPHGMAGNLASPLDLAKLAAECFKIPLFSQISSTKRCVIRTKEIDDDGEVLGRTILLENTNKLLERGCVGGKTGSSVGGGQSFLGAFPGSMVIVVLGSAGRQQRFHDWMRLAEWVGNKLQQLK